VVRSIWQVEGLTSFRNEHIMPKGVVEIIFNFSEGTFVNAKMGDTQYQLGRCFINGYNSLPIQMQLPEQRFFFGVVLQPVAVKQLLKIPAAEFADLPADLALIDPFFDRLWHRLAEATTFNDKVSIISNWAEKFSIDNDPREQMLNDFLHSSAMLNISVSGLAKTLCWSPRHMSRKIQEITGMNTEETLLYKKYLHAIELMHHKNIPLTEIAYDCHFTDQSHFIKSFKTFTQLTPGEYLRNKSHLQGHIFE